MEEEEVFSSSGVGDSQGSKPGRLRRTCSNPRGEGLGDSSCWTRTEARRTASTEDLATAVRLPARILIYQRTCGTLRTGVYQHSHSLREQFGIWHPDRADFSSTTHTLEPRRNRGRSRRTTTPEHALFVFDVGKKHTWVVDLGRWLVHRPLASSSECSRSLSRAPSPSLSIR
jgi:hypothetical protein